MCSATDVIKLTGTTLDPCIIETWIEVAEQLISDRSDCINGTDELNEKICLQLSSHFVTINDGGDDSNITSDKADALQTQWAKADITNSINETVYGKAANALSKGCLSNYDEQSIGLCAIGGSC